MTIWLCLIGSEFGLHHWLYQNASCKNESSTYFRTIFSKNHLRISRQCPILELSDIYILFDVAAFLQQIWSQPNCNFAKSISPPEEFKCSKCNLMVLTWQFPVCIFYMPDHFLCELYFSSGEFVCGFFDCGEPIPM